MARLTRRAGYWATYQAWRTPTGVMVLHEDEECLTRNCRGKVPVHLTLAEARACVKARKARLCKRCSKMT